jgi:hypothetical protein
MWLRIRIQPGLDKSNGYARMWWEVRKSGNIPLTNRSYACKGGKMDTIIKDTDLEMVAASVKPDAKKRVILTKVPMEKGVTYRIYMNSFGQIVLDPQVTIPASELWLFNNPVALASVQRGLADAAQGKVSKVGLDTL